MNGRRYFRSAGFLAKESTMPRPCHPHSPRMVGVTCIGIIVLVMSSPVLSAPPSPADNNGLSQSATPAQEPVPSATNDALDAALERAGTSRRQLGFSPQGWWARYPRSTQYKLPHVDALLAEPLAVVPFSRNLAAATRAYLSHDAINVAGNRTLDPGEGHGLSRLLQTTIALRWYGGIWGTFSASYLSSREEALDQAILELYRYAGEPTYYAPFFGTEPYQPDIAGELHRRAAHLSPEVSRILGRLVLDILDAHRSAALAFRNISVEQRVAIANRMDINNLGAMGGVDYRHTFVFDDVAEKWDEASLWLAAIKCTQALDDARLALAALPEAKRGSGSFDWQTPLGWIRVRGTGRDDIDATDSLLVIDLGGNDHWRGSIGASSPNRLISLALDLAGNDLYEGDGPTQGAGVTGVGILVDAAGDDRYLARNYAQGIGQFGLGALFDLGGSDIYQAQDSAQGSGFFNGIGLLADAEGNDRYEILANGQGFGGPGGVGILADRQGDDVYRAEPDAKISGRNLTDATHSVSGAQGFGLGRFIQAGGHSWAGGLGGLIDVEGNDSYVAGSWSQAMGYWFGTGLLVDGGGRDRYAAYGGHSQAFGVHYGIAALLDEGGDDMFRQEGGGMGVAEDVSVALFVNVGGNDSYTLKPLSQDWEGFGSSNDRSPLAAFIDEGGDDVYELESSDADKAEDANDGRQRRPGFARLRPGLAVGPDGIGDVANVIGRGTPYFGYLNSTGLFLDVGGRDRYSWDRLRDGAVWGDAPGSENWKLRNVGVGMDVSDGSVDWRPLQVRGN